MSDFPPVLTPERIDAMLSGLAELCFAGAVLAGERQKTAEDPEAFERATRALQTSSRNLRQTIAMKQRFDRQQAQAAAAAQDKAETARKAAETARVIAVDRHIRQARIHVKSMLWHEYEPEEAEAFYDDMNDCLTEISEDDPDDFLNTPINTLVSRLSEMFEVGAFDPRPRPDDEDGDDPPDPPTDPPPAGPGYSRPSHWGT
jgi:hypothetical protein